MSITKLYKELYQRHLNESGPSARKIARESHLHHSTIMSFFKSESGTSYENLVKIGEALKVDRVRAFIAIEILHDVNLYEHPGLKLLSHILPGFSSHLCGPESQVSDDLKDNECETICRRIITETDRSLLAKISAMQHFHRTTR